MDKFDRRLEAMRRWTDLKLDRLIDSWGKQRTKGHPGRKKPD
jgi:hypothetical protein